MIVTIDGPAGAGKSSVARALAKNLGFEFLDTGAMYRAVAWAALRDEIDLNQPDTMVEIAKKIEIRFESQLILVDGADVTTTIRSTEVTEHVKHAAGNDEVRAILGSQQRTIGLAAKNLVTEGRDQGTIVFPEAECKIYLTATPEERARRRYRELLRQGEVITFADVLDSQNSRDAADESRDVGPLAQAKDAVEVYTDEMTQEQVLNHLVWVVESSRG